MLTPEQVTRLDEILEGVTDDQVTDWERKFIDDISERYEKFEDRLLLSPRQWEVLEKIAEKCQV